MSGGVERYQLRRNTQQKQQTLQSVDELSHHEDCRTASCSDANEDAAEDLVRVLGAGGAGDRPPSGVGASGQLRLFNHPSAAAPIAGLQAGGSSSWRNIRGRHPKQPVRDAPQQGGRGGCARSRGDASVARHPRPRNTRRHRRPRKHRRPHRRGNLGEHRPPQHRGAVLAELHRPGRRRFPE